MTDSVHPTPDELADLQADLLSDAELDRVLVHVSDCRDCAAALAALDDVQATLAEAGSSDATMPDDVAAELDLAIMTASRERAAAVPSLDGKREQAASRTSRRTSWVWIAGAAAAAVVVIGSIGLGGLDGMQSGDDSDNSADAGSAADSAGGDSLVEPEAASPEEDAPSRSGDPLYASPPRLTPDSLSEFANRLVTKQQRPAASNRTTATECAANLPVASSRSVLYLEIFWEGQPAVLVTDPTVRTASVFGCGTGAEPLYSTSY